MCVDTADKNELRYEHYITFLWEAKCDKVLSNQ